MSHLIAPSHTVVDSIPLGRRIYEIAKEKGSAFTITAMSNRLNMSRETLRLMIKGEREIYTFELENISALLNMPIERILQEDIRERVDKFRKLLDEKLDIDQAIQIGTELIPISNGMTEKAIYLSELAKAYFAKDDIQNAHTLLENSYSYAEQAAEKFGDFMLLYNVLSKLMLTYTQKQDFTKLSNILDRVGPLLNSNPNKQGLVHYAKAMIAVKFKNVDQEREHLYKSLECYRSNLQPSNMNNIGRAELNVGYHEFRQKNYALAKNYLEQALEHLGNDFPTKLIAIKDYVKILIKLGDLSEAIKLIEDTLPHTEEYPDLKGKLYLLLSIAKNDTSYAETVFSIPNVGNKILRLVCRFMTKYYINIGDSEAVMKYYILEEEYFSEQNDIMHEEDL